MKRLERNLNEISDELKEKNDLRIFLRKSLKYLEHMLNSQIKENKELEGKSKAVGKPLTVEEKRNMLKTIYARVLKKHGRERDISIFNSLIDKSPEDYLDYELKIDTEAGADAIEDFRNGVNPLDQSQIEVFTDLFQSVGKPALEKYATGKHKLPTETGALGAEQLNRGFREYNRIRKDIDSKPDFVRGGMPSINAPRIPEEFKQKIRREMSGMFNVELTPEIAEILSGLKMSKPKRNIENDIMRIMLSSDNKESAKQKLSQIEADDMSAFDFNKLWNFAEKEKIAVRERK